MAEKYLIVQRIVLVFFLSSSLFSHLLIQSFVCWCVPAASGLLDWTATFCVCLGMLSFHRWWLALQASHPEWEGRL